MLQSGWERKSTTKRFATGRFSPCTWKISSQMRCRVQHSKRNFISTSNHVFFVYDINTTALYWQEKSTFLMNENKRINNPWIRVLKCVDTLKMKTSVESIQNQTVGLIFKKKKKLTVIELVLTDRKKSFRYTGRGKSSSRWFSFSSKSSWSSFVSVCTAFAYLNLNPR